MNKTVTALKYIESKLHAGEKFADVIADAKMKFNSPVPNGFQIYDEAEWDDANGKSTGRHWFAFYPHGFGGKRSYTSQCF